MPSDLSKRMIHDRCIIISIPAACIIKSVNDKNKLCMNEFSDEYMHN